MFKKWKDRLSEVSEEVKRDPRFQTGLASVNQFAESAVSALNRERSPVRDSDNNANNNDHLYSLGEDDELDEDLDEENKDNEESKRTRRTSSGSTMSDSVANLFPIYESPQQMYTLPSDLESSAGSEWGDDNASTSSQLSAVSKEQLLQLLQKTRARHRKYKARFMEAANAFKEMQKENEKIKGVMQQTQDKALRRISELRDQCQLQERAKRHLEEELRSDIEEKEHVINALETKITLLKSNHQSEKEKESNENEGKDLIDLKPQAKEEEKTSDDPAKPSNNQQAEKIKRLEALLSKCKDTIETNKSKMAALTAVRESVASELKQKEEECQRLREEVKQHEETSRKAREEEIQIAETKMIMHQEIIVKDEQISSLKTSLQSSEDRLSNQDKVITALEQQLNEQREREKQVEALLETEKADALQEMSRGKASALQTLKEDMEQKMKELERSHQSELNQQRERLAREKEEALNKAQKEKERELKLQEGKVRELLAEKDEECRLATEEIQLRLSSMASNDSDLEYEMQAKINAITEENQKEVGRLQKLLKDSEGQVTQLKLDLETKLADVECLKSKTNQLNEDFNTEKQDMAKELDDLRKQCNALIEEGKEQQKVRKNLEDLEKVLEKEREEHRSSLANLETVTKEVPVLKETLEAVQNEFRSLLSTVGQKLTEMTGETISDDRLLTAENILSGLDQLNETLISDKSAIQNSEEALAAKDSEREEIINNLKIEINELEQLLQASRDLLEKETSDRDQTLNQLREAKDELEKKLMRTEDMLKESAEAEERLKADLSEKKEELENLITAGDETKANLMTQLNLEKSRLEQEITDLKSEAENHKSSLKDFEESCQILQEKEKEQNCLAASLQSEIKELKNALQESTNSLESEKNALIDQRKRQEEVQLQLKEATETQERLRTELVAKTAELDERKLSSQAEEEKLKNQFSSEASRLESELSELRKELEECQSSLQKSEEQCQSLQSKTFDYEQISQNHQSEIDQLKKALQDRNDTNEKNEALKEQELKETNALREVLQLRLLEAQTLQKETEEERDRLQGELDAKIVELEQSSKSHKNQEELKTQLSATTERYEGQISELMKELSSLRDRDRASEELKQQMINYEKSLQAKIRVFEENEQVLKQEKAEQMEELQRKEKALSDLEERMNSEISRIKSELELKASNEGERDTTLKELQSQSIEYQKRLQEQLEEAQLQVNEGNEKQQTLMNNHKIEVEMLTGKIDHLTEIITKLESDDRDAKDSLSVIAKERDDLKQRLEDLSDQIGSSKKDDELSRLQKQLASVENRLAASSEREANLHSQLSSMRTQHELAVQTLEQETRELRSETATTNVEDGWDHDTIDLQANDDPSNMGASHALEEATEFEYLRNILFEYMMGKETDTLAKVLATIVKFSPEQVQAVIEHEERRHKARNTFKPAIRGGQRP